MVLAFSPGRSERFFFPKYQDWLWSPYSIRFTGCRVLSRGGVGHEGTPTSILGMTGAIPLLLQYAFMAFLGRTLPLPLPLPSPSP
jgi:hypothetical protein